MTAVSVCSQSRVLCLQARLKIDHLGQCLLMRNSSPDFNVLQAYAAVNFIANKRESKRKQPLFAMAAALENSQTADTW